MTASKAFSANRSGAKVAVVCLGRGDAGVAHDLGEQLDRATAQDELAGERVARALVPGQLGELAFDQGRMQVAKPGTLRL